MPIDPHTITVTVNDTDNSTAKSGVKVYMLNVSNKTTMAEQVTDAQGQVIFDLANFSAPVSGDRYDTGDETFIIAYDGFNSDFERYVVAGDSHESTLNLNPVPHFKKGGSDTGANVGNKMRGLIAANTTSSVYEVKVYALDTGRLLVQLECPANNTTILEHLKLMCSGGYAIVRENSGVVVTVLQ